MGRKKWIYLEMCKLCKNNELSLFTGRFLNKTLEDNFQREYIEDNINYFRQIALIVGIVFFLFSINDLMVIENRTKLALILFLRLIFLLASVLIYAKPNYFLNPNRDYLWGTLYELIGVFIYFIIVYNYPLTHSMIQSLSTTLLILIIFFVIPNLIPLKQMVSIVTATGFLVFSFIKYHPPISILFDATVYIGLVIFFSSLASLKLAVYKRLNYLDRQKLLELSIRDPLTHAYNRLKFDEALVYELNVARRYGTPFSLILLDIDHFKKLNDENGHIFGDKVLVQVSELIQKSIREVDVFARWGGEEFMLLLPQTKCQEASLLAERLRERIAKETWGSSSVLTCSFGVTTCAEDDTEDSMLERVDKALYSAKKSGRNLVITVCNREKVTA